MIYIVVPTFAGVQETKKMLISLEKNIKKDYKVLIVDDHPENVTFSAISSNKVEVFTPKEELWWVGSVNLGIKLLLEKFNLHDEDTVVIANNDVQIKKNCFEILHQEIQKNKYSIVHPRTFDYDLIEVSSGAKVISFFPYITKHPKSFKKYKEIIDMGTARFLMMSGFVLKKVGYINKNLVQYGGDNYFTLSAQRFHNINTYILRDATCIVDKRQTGIKIDNIQNIKELYQSFFSIKSPNNIKFRYRLFEDFFGMTGAFFITLSITLNTITKFIFRKR
tara:strand:+ start:912 stop:1745 length:834 start_codon:yes stop_codon:yes gene_type:complete